jgi:putative tricarboxylic transport membrane protein
MEAKMRSRDIYSSLFWMATGIGICYGGYDLELGALRDPGSGFLFFWLGVFIIGLSLAVLIRALRETPTPRGIRAIWAGVSWKKIISVLVVLFVYAYLFTPVGFILTTIPLLIFLFKAVEPQKWSWAILGAVISTLAAYGLFRIWLQCQLPQGLLGI